MKSSGLYSRYAGWSIKTLFFPVFFCFFRGWEKQKKTEKNTVFFCFFLFFSKTEKNRKKQKKTHFSSCFFRPQKKHISCFKQQNKILILSRHFSIYVQMTKCLLCSNFLFMCKLNRCPTILTFILIKTYVLFLRFQVSCGHEIPWNSTKLHYVHPFLFLLGVRFCEKVFSPKGWQKQLPKRWKSQLV